MVYLPCISVFSSLFNTIHITFSLLYPILFLVFRYNIDFLIKLYNWIKFSSYIILGLFLIRSSTPYISITSTIHSNLFNDQQWFVFSYACLIWTHSSSYHNYIIVLQLKWNIPFIWSVLLLALIIVVSSSDTILHFSLSSLLYKNNNNNNIIMKIHST